MKSRELNKYNSIIDDVFENYGYGLKTWKVIVYILLIINIQGIQLTTYAYMIIPLKSFYLLTDTGFNILSSSIFIGIILGSLFIGIFSNKFTRDWIILTFLLKMFISNIIMAFTKSLIILAICRLLIGISIGITIPLSITLLAEYLPSKNRFLVLSLVHVSFRIGQLLLLLIILIIMPNFEPDKVQKVILLISFFSLITFIYGLFIKESPRTLILKNKEEKAFEILELYLNEKLSKSKKLIIINQNITINNESNGSFFDLFSSRYFILTILLVLIGFNSLMGFYGTLLTSGLTLKNIKHDETSVIKNEIYIILIGLATLLFLSPISDMKSLSRKGSFIVFSVIAFVFSLLCVNYQDYFFIWYGFVLSLNGVIQNNIVNYATELYPSKLKDNGTGIIFSFGRLGAFVSQLVYISLYEKDIWLPYYFTAGLMIFNIILILLLPVEKIKKSNHKDLDEEKSYCEEETAISFSYIEDKEKFIEKN